MKLILLVLAAAGLTLAADKYTVYETEHFELITDGPRGRAQDILAQFERVRSFFVKGLAMKDPVLKPRIVVFQHEKDYRLYSINQVSAAHYTALPHRDYIAIGPVNNDRDNQITVHEYVHLLVRYADTPMPVWMNEGVAEVYSNLAPVKKVIQVGAPIPDHIVTIRNQWLPLAEVVGAEHDSPYYNRRQHVGPFYGISWALVHMLMLDERYRANFGKLAPALAAGTEPAEAFQQTFGKPIAAIEKDLQEYIRRTTMNVVNYEAQFDKVDQKVAPRPVTAYEWGVATADLLAAIRKHEEAGTRLSALAAAEPGRPEAWEALAFARWRGAPGEAAEAFDKARATGSTQPNLAYWAPALSKDRALARQMLQEVVERYPQFSDARIRLAEMQMYNREFDTAVATLKGLPKISRKQVPAYFPVYIQASWYAGKLPEARSAASQFITVSRGGEEKEKAKRWFAFAMKEPPKLEAAVPEYSAPELRAEEDGEIGVSEDPEVVKLRRNPLTYVTGELVHLECIAVPVLHFKNGAELLKIAIDSAEAFQVIGAENNKGELACGDQSVPARLGYYPKEGLAGGATGVARSIEFRKP